MNPTLTSDCKLAKVRLTVNERKRLEGTRLLLEFLKKFDVGPARNALTHIDKLVGMINDKNEISFIGEDGMVQASLFEPGSTDEGDQVDPKVEGDPEVTLSDNDSAFESSEDVTTRFEPIPVIETGADSASDLSALQSGFESPTNEGVDDLSKIPEERGE